MSYDENRISDQIDGGLIEKENSIKKTITELENESDELGKMMFNLSNEIIKHLHNVYDTKLESFKNFDVFLRDINSYAGDTFGKLMYINYAKNVINKRKRWDI